MWMYHLFYKRSVHPRNPHSFPTRRSSDLRHWSPSQQRSRHERAATGNAATRGQRRGPQHRTGDCTANADRKSTRLNSSHLVISYAVFCLKKKNSKKKRRTEQETTSNTTTT